MKPSAADTSRFSICQMKFIQTQQNGLSVEIWLKGVILLFGLQYTWNYWDVLFTYEKNVILIDGRYFTDSLITVVYSYFVSIITFVMIVRSQR